MIEYDGTLPFDDRGNLPETAGIYFVTDGDNVVYIGKSINIRTRWQSNNHHRYSDVCELENPLISWVVADPTKLDDLEQALIDEISPGLNGHVPAYTYTPRPERQQLERVVVLLPVELYDAFKAACEERYDTMSNMGRRLFIDWIKREYPHLIEEPPKPGPKTD